MLIAEDLLLLLTDDDTGKPAISGSQVDIALAGANLVELTLLDRVGLTKEGEPGRPGRITVRDRSATGDPLLDDALGILVERQGTKPSAVMGALGKGVRAALYGRLVDRGILRADHGSILGIFPTKKWPTDDAQHESALRHQLTNVLVQGSTPDARVASLVSLLFALKAVHKVVDPQQHGLSRSDLNKRAEQIADGSWGSKAVRQAVDEMMAAIVVATTVSAATVATS